VFGLAGVLVWCQQLLYGSSTCLPPVPNSIHVPSRSRDLTFAGGAVRREPATPVLSQRPANQLHFSSQSNPRTPSRAPYQPQLFRPATAPASAVTFAGEGAAPPPPPLAALWNPSRDAVAAATAAAAAAAAVGASTEQFWQQPSAYVVSQFPAHQLRGGRSN
jgi:hypothetical protein